MAETDLVIKFEGKEINVLKNIDKIVAGLELLEKKSKETSDQAEKGANKVIEAFKKMAAAVGTTSAQMSVSLAPISNAFMKLAGYIGVTGFSGVLYKSIQASRAFSGELRKVSTIISGDATPAIARYKTEVLALSKESGKTTTELTRGLYKILTSGVKGAEDAGKAMQFLSVAVETGEAGLTDTTTAISAMTTVLNAYGKDVSQASKVSDTLFTMAKEGRISFQQLAYQIGPVANVAARAGVNFEELAAAVVTMAKNGVTGRKAIFAMNGMIEAFLRPSKELNREVKKLGEGFADAGDMLKKKGLVYSMQKLNEIASGSEKNLKILVPGFSNLKTVSILAGQGMDQFAEAAERMRTATGATQEAADKIAGGFGEKWERFTAKVQALFIAVGDKLMPVITAGLVKLSAWLDENGDELAKTLASIAGNVMGFFSFLVKHGDTILRIWAELFAVQKIAAFTAHIWKLVTAFKALNVASKANIIVGGAILAYEGLSALHANRMEEYAQMRAKAKKETEEKAAKQANALDLFFPQEGKNYYAPPPPMISTGTKDKGPKLPTEDELKRWAAERAKTEAFIHGIQIVDLNEIDKLQEEYEKKRVEMEKLRFKNEDEKQETLQALDHAHFLKMNKLLLEQEQKRKDFEKKLYEDGLKALQEYKDLREKAGIEEQKKRDESEKYLQDLSLERLDEKQRKEIEYQREVQKIQEMHFENEADRLTALQLLADKQKKSTEPGFWDQVAIGFARRIGERLMDWAMSVADAITSPISELLGSFGQIASIPFSKFSSIFGGILGGSSLADTKKAAMEAVAFINAIVKNLPVAIDWFAKEGFPLIMKAFVDNLPTIINALVQAIPVFLDTIIANMDKIITPFVHGMLELIPALIDRIPDFIEAIISEIPRIIDEVIAAIPAIAYALAKAVVDFVKQLVNDATGNLFSSLNLKEKMAKMAEKAKSQRSNVTTAHSGLYLAESFSRAVRAHSGFYVPGGLSPNEVPIIGQVGEAVMNSNWVRNAGGKEAINRMNATGMVGGGVINNIVNVQHMFSSDSGEVVDSLVASNLRQGKGRAKRYIRAGKVPGYAAR